jgi:hypothetical protein
MQGGSRRGATLGRVRRARADSPVNFGGQLSAAIHNLAIGEWWICKGSWCARQYVAMLGWGWVVENGRAEIGGRELADGEREMRTGQDAPSLFRPPTVFQAAGPVLGTRVT